MPKAQTPVRTKRLTFRLGYLAAFVAASAVLAHAPDARAQNTDRVLAGNGAGMDLHLFRPAIDSKGFFSVNGADVLAAGDLSLGLVLDYGHAMMPLNDGHSTDYLVHHAFQGTLQFDYGFLNRLVVGLSVPVVWNVGDAATDIGATGHTYDDASLSGQALGNLAIHAKLRLLSPDKIIGVALLAQVGFGAGETRNFASDPGFFYWPEVVVEKRFGALRPLRIGVNLGYRGHTGDNPEFGLGRDGLPQLTNGTFQYANLLTGGLGVSYRVVDPLDLVAETYFTNELGGGSNGAQKFSAEALGGIKLFIERSSFLMLGFGAGYTDGFQAAQERAVLGIVFEPSIGDRDHDGIKDDEDDCPDEPEDYDGFQDTKADSPPGRYGCPDPDNDGDGIPDVRDKCPDQPENFDGKEDSDGCPEGHNGDRDGDGVLDSHDKCPDQPEDRDGFEDADGCPDPDNDKDGVPDKIDKCPNDPEDKDGFEDADGCPDPDNDKDGIPDAQDKCPNDPENFNGFEDEDGCPDKSNIIIQGNDIVILQKILFKTGSAELLPASMPIVTEVAETLKHHPEFTMIEVQGHADARADEGYNLRLTQSRANAVVAALVKGGVSATRLRAMGYGEYCPVDPADTPEALEKNRRVEFKVVSTKDGPTGVALGCDLSKSKKIGVR